MQRASVGAKTMAMANIPAQIQVMSSKVEVFRCFTSFLKVPGMAGMAGPGQPTEVLCLLNMVVEEELVDEVISWKSPTME